MVLAQGHREHVKFAALKKLTLKTADWVDGPSDWRAPFLPEQEGVWAKLPPLVSLYEYNGSGVMPGRTWIIAPDVGSLEDRWSRLIRENDTDRKELLFHPHLRIGEPGDKHVGKSVARQLAGSSAGLGPVASETGPVTAPTARYAFRTLDRQWIIQDARLINQPNPTLWNAHSDSQVVMTGLAQAPAKSGPAVTFASTIPDLDHYHGRGGRVYPLWRNAEATPTAARSRQRT